MNINEIKEEIRNILVRYSAVRYPKTMIFRSWRSAEVLLSFQSFR